MTEIREVLQDNPASRLLAILNMAINGKYLEHEQSGVIWAKILRVGNEPTEFLPAYSKLFILTDDAYKTVIKFYPRQKATHAKWRNQITTCLKSNSPYHHQWKDVVAKLRQPGVIDMLQVAEDNLAHFVMPTIVDKLSIEKLKEEFENLKNKIFSEESFSDQLKKFLICELEKILDTLDHYELNGSAPIRDSIYNIVSNSDLEQNNTFQFKKQLCGFLIVAASTISIVNDIADFPESLDYLKEKIFSVNPGFISPKFPEKAALPKELAVFRKEE